MSSKQLAAMLQTAMKIREDSYDRVRADLDAANDQLYDVEEYYGRTLREAAAMAADKYDEPEMADILFYLLHSYWNDVQVWWESLK